MYRCVTSILIREGINDMCKKIALLFISMVVCVSAFCSCDKYNAVKLTGDKGETLEYNNMLYYETSLFNISYNWKDETSEGKNIQELGWFWFVPLLGETVFYSDDTETPDYIFGSRTLDHCVYLNENYDYKNSEFIIDDTDIAITLSTICYDEEIYDVDSSQISSVVRLVAHSEDHPVLELNLEIYQLDETFLVQFGTKVYYELTPEFLDSLRSANLL